MTEEEIGRLLGKVRRSVLRASRTRDEVAMVDAIKSLSEAFEALLKLPRTVTYVTQTVPSFSGMTICGSLSTTSSPHNIVWPVDAVSTVKVPEERESGLKPGGHIDP